MLQVNVFKSFEINSIIQQFSINYSLKASASKTSEGETKYLSVPLHRGIYNIVSKAQEWFSVKANTSFQAFQAVTTIKWKILITRPWLYLFSFSRDSQARRRCWITSIQGDDSQASPLVSPKSPDARVNPDLKSGSRRLWNTHSNHHPQRNPSSSPVPKASRIGYLDLQLSSCSPRQTSGKGRCQQKGWQCSQEAFISLLRTQFVPLS